ncbi:hypothetical protein EOA32_03260 [Mesorhizobium sp. M1A.F.Ca.ET.072.01.1.1]|uniref:hypothetical protein n=1 Tax=Mesorhizobium sp. M1A.F.Ca.ET.072.01.1.1 TaxID=2496753 RepID=UPI000FD61D41|nr:hypothetical protein [Mesorhizobium sp. M1A.F.Ca.ET.072.01.1.1]RUW55055.1 hypothetical protein EOA32_03260 [Mesorhizobium sp. M1A.F.Ca.ET.072.01.1.1]TIV04707.1 MAG: hypothetical protein E5W04_02145 [Mesorhizobium sp.]
MATQILATANTAADSADVIVAAGTPLAVGLKGVADGGALVIIKLKDDAGAYNVVGSLTSTSPSTLISAPGTYRFSRVAGATCGVFSG